MAKTTTLGCRRGNMPLRFMKRYKFLDDGSLAPEQEVIIQNLGDVMPQNWFPDCICFNASAEIAANAVGLSGPGALPLLNFGDWQKRTKPFLLSFMSVATTREKRFEEFQNFVNLLSARQKDFQAPFALQINGSCPNVKIEQTETAKEMEDNLNYASILGIPLIPKFNILLPPEIAAQISQHEACDAICATNTIPWNAMWPTLQAHVESKTGWKNSPLAKYGGGGVSSEFIRHFLINWIKQAKQAGLKKPINAGGGITRSEHVEEFAGLVESISIGSAVMFACARFNPCRVQQIIKKAHQIFGE